MMVTVLTAEGSTQLSNECPESAKGLWLSQAALNESTRWQLKDEGLCKDEICVPLSSQQRDSLVDGDKIDVSGLWAMLDRPLLHDQNQSTWMLGESAADRSRQLESLQAPDFALPDLEGNIHHLSDNRGQKIFLTTWASW